MKQLIYLALIVFMLGFSVNQCFAYETAISSTKTHAVTALQNVHQTPQPTKKQSTALILAAVDLFFPIGLQRFYLGYTTIGIIMLVLTITGIGILISWIWSLIDLIRIANGTLKPADGSDYVDVF